MVKTIIVDDNVHKMIVDYQEDVKKHQGFVPQIKDIVTKSVDQYINKVTEITVFGETRELLKNQGLEQEMFAIYAKAIVDETRQRDRWDMSYIQEKINSMQRFADTINELNKKGMNENR